MSSNQHRASATSERAACRFESCVNRHVDGELDAGHAMDVENHLAECGPCDENAKLLRAMKASLRRRGSTRAPDDLRAKLSLVLARENVVSFSDDRPSMEGMTPHPGSVSSSVSSSASSQPSVAVFSSASSATRDSLMGGAHDRAQREVARLGGGARQESSRSSRVAYGVGAFAVAAGVAMALVGERYGESVNGAQASTDETSVHRMDVAGMGDGAVQASRRDASGRPANPSRPSPANVEGPSGVDAQGIPTPGSTGLVLIANPPSTNPSASVPTVPFNMSGRVSFDTLLDDLVALHANPLPPETTNPDDMRKYDALVGVKVRRPTLRPFAASFRGARLHAMRDAQRTAMLQYILGNGHHVTVYVFNPREMQLGTTHMQPRVVREEPIYVGSVRGYSVAAAERRGVGYALATDMGTDDSVRMVASSLP